MALVYSYIRFSSKAQTLGDSLRRQLENADKWLAQHPEHTLAALKLHDLGMPSHRGENRTKGALGLFLDAIKAGDVKSGSILLIEAFDRLSREGIRAGMKIIESILEAGVTIVSLIPYEITLTPDGTDNLTSVMIISVAFHLGWLESAQKSQRVRSHWDKQRTNAATTGSRLDTRHPAWMDWDKKAKAWKLNGGAEAVKYIYRKAIEGLGQRKILSELVEKFTPMGTSNAWTLSYVGSILRDGSVLGERQPHQFDDEGQLVPVGQPLTSYYPRVIEEADFYRAQHQKAQRTRQKGREATEHVNLLKGLLRCVDDGQPMHLQSFPGAQGGRQMRYVSYDHNRKRRGACPVSVPVEAVERAVLQVLAEVDPKALEANPQRGEHLRAREQELAGVASRLEELGDQLADPAMKNLPAVLSAVAKLERQKEQVAAEVEKLRAEAHVDEPLGRAREVLVMLDEAKQDKEKLQGLRLRLRGLIGELVEEVWLKVEKHYGRVFGVGQLHFPNGTVRGFMVVPVQGAYSEPGERLPIGQTQDIRGLKGKQVMGEFAKIMLNPGSVAEPDVVPDTLGEAAEVWLDVARGRISKQSFRVIPSKVRRFVEAMSADTPVKDIDAKLWGRWVRFLKQQVKAKQLEASTARVTYGRARELVEWLIGRGVVVQFDGFDRSAAKMLAP